MIYYTSIIIIIIGLYFFYNHYRAKINEKEDMSMDIYEHKIFDNEYKAPNVRWNIEDKKDGNITSNCYNKDLNTCNNYTNCGLCLTKNGKPICLPGDIDGPFFSEKCDEWKYIGEYNNIRCLDDKKYKNNIYDPWNKYYPVLYDTKYPSPKGIFGAI